VSFRCFKILLHYISVGIKRIILFTISMSFEPLRPSHVFLYFRKSSFVHSADLRRGEVRVRVRGKVRAVIDRYAMSTLLLCNC